MTPPSKWSLIAVGALTVAGCRDEVTSIPSSPAPRSCSSNKDMNGLHFSFDKWDEGFAIMFVDNVNGEVDSQGTSSESTYSKRVSVRRSDGIGYDWQLATSDGKSARLIINGNRYDLSNGTLFVIHVEGRNVVVHQLDQDLSMLSNNIPKCTSFVNNNTEVRKLLRDGAATR